MAIKISGSTIIDDSRGIVNAGVSTISALTVTNNINANGNIVGDNSTNLSGINELTAGGTAIFGASANDVVLYGSSKILRSPPVPNFAFAKSAKISELSDLSHVAL